MSWPLTASGRLAHAAISPLPLPLPPPLLLLLLLLLLLPSLGARLTPALAADPVRDPVTEPGGDGRVVGDGLARSTHPPLAPPLPLPPPEEGDGIGSIIGGIGGIGGGGTFPLPGLARSPRARPTTGGAGLGSSDGDSPGGGGPRGDGPGGSSRGNACGRGCGPMGCPSVVLRPPPSFP